MKQRKTDVYLTQPELAARLRVKAETVHKWIRGGELRAVNVARREATRPRYRIPLDAIIQFENARAAVQEPTKPVRRQRKSQANVIFKFSFEARSFAEHHYRSEILFEYAP